MRLVLPRIASLLLLLLLLSAATFVGGIFPKERATFNRFVLIPSRLLLLLPPTIHVGQHK
jgi:hypothetical protein